MRSLTRRAALAVCVALLLVTAGCNGATSPTSTATTTAPSTTTGPTTTTSSSTTATGTWSPNAPAELYPPGIAANGTLTNITALLDAHFEETANQSLVFTSELTRPDEHRVRRYAHGASETPYYSKRIRTTDDGDTVIEYYQTAPTGFLRRTFDNRSSYTVTQNTTVYGNRWLTDGTFGPRFSLQDALLTGNYSVNGTVERDGRTYVQLTADEPSARGADMGTSAYEGAVLVTPDGVVHDVEATAVTERDGTTVPIEVSMTLDRSGDWPGKPSWVDDLPHLSLSIVEGGHALEIRNAGGAALPANTTFEVYAQNATDPVYVAPGDDADATGTITTDARLEPGDALYVTASTEGTGRSFTVHDEPTRGEYTFGAAKIRRDDTVIYSLVTGTQNDRSREGGAS